MAAGPAPPGTGHVARNTAIFSFGTGISRVAGLGREIIAASYFGTSAAASAFTIAYLVPNLVANLFANAVLSAAFVPVFTDLLQKDRRGEALRLARTLFWVMLTVLGAISAVRPGLCTHSEQKSGRSRIRGRRRAHRLPTQPRRGPS